MKPLSTNGTFDKNGFTLVEIAIVLVIVGMLIAGGVSLIGPLTSMSKFRESRDNISASCEAINSWAAGNNRIPPFPPLAPDVAAAGFDKIIQKQTDSWSNPLIYIYDTNLAPTGGIAATKNTICGRRSTLITVNDTVTLASISNVAYVIISRGDDAIINTTFGAGGPVVASGPQGAAPPITTITANTTLDIVKWVTLDELRSKAGCQGAQLKIVNNELPAGSVATPYSAKIIADGGVQFAAPNSYSWCVQTAIVGTPPAGLTFQKPNAAGNPIPIPNVVNLFQTNCATYAVANWPQAGQLMLSGNPAPSASHFFTVFLSDNNANVTSKPFVLTVNP